MTHQTNEALIKDFKNHLDYYKDLKDKWEFLKTPDDRAFHAGKTQGMLLGLEVIERISIPQPEQLEVYLTYLDLPEFLNGTNVTVHAKENPLDDHNIIFEGDEKSALDFCKRFNLKVTNEEKE